MLFTEGQRMSNAPYCRTVRLSDGDVRTSGFTSYRSLSSQQTAFRATKACLFREYGIIRQLTCKTHFSTLFPKLTIFKKAYFSLNNDKPDDKRMITKWQEQFFILIIF